MMTDKVKHYINHCEENVINLTDTDSSSSSENSKEIMQDNFDLSPKIRQGVPV